MLHNTYYDAVSSWMLAHHLHEHAETSSDETESDAQNAPAADPLAAVHDSDGESDTTSASGSTQSDDDTSDESVGGGNDDEDDPEELIDILHDNHPDNMLVSSNDELSGSSDDGMMGHEDLADVAGSDTDSQDESSEDN